MRSSAVAAIVFANVNDELMKRVTAKRSMASVPFGARYRLIDFTLSNMVNAGITSIGIITKENYRSLMDHVGNGIYWDLDRKSGGLYLLPPYRTSGTKRYSGTVDALNGSKDFINRCKAEYIVLARADTVANVDISRAVKLHIDRKADISLVYHNGPVPKNGPETLVIKADNDGRITKIEPNTDDGRTADYGIGITIISRELLSRLIAEAASGEITSFNVDVLAEKVKQLKIFGVEHSEYTAVMYGKDSYYDASMDLLNSDVRAELFNPERPIYTKTRDDMPTRYGTKADVKNCFIADGCVIDGTVKNSILFRGVRVEKGAVIENCILMQETAVGQGAQISQVISDKNAVISENIILKGTSQKRLFVKKNQTV